MKPTHRDQFPAFLHSRCLTGEAAEIGVFEGEYAHTFLSQWIGVRLVGIDPFFNFSWAEYRDGCNKANMESTMAKALKRLAPHGDRFQLVREKSPEAAALFPLETFDFIYIDANHSYASVLADLEAWWPKLRKGGVLAGHDFYTRDDVGAICQVPQAVREFTAAHPVRDFTSGLACTSWYCLKPV